MSYYEEACRGFLNAPFASEQDEKMYNSSFQEFIRAKWDKDEGISVDSLRKFSMKHINVAGTEIMLWKGDITKLSIDSIVNAANESLLGGGGVDFAIHNAAGPTLVKECATLGGCEVGEAKITKGYYLPAKTVIHTVGPILDGKNSPQPDMLAKCYESCLFVLQENGLRSIAYCCISCGFYGFPNDLAAETAFSSVISTISSRRSSIDTIVFCVFDDNQEKAYHHVFDKYIKENTK